MVEEEVKKVPILNDISEHEVLGRARQEEGLTIVRRLIEKRFGSVPKWAQQRLAKLSAKELEELSVRVHEAKSIESLLK